MNKYHVNEDVGQYDRKNLFTYSPDSSSPYLSALIAQLDTIEYTTFQSQFYSATDLLDDKYSTNTNK